mgnify:FL=1
MVRPRPLSRLQPDDARIPPGAEEPVNGAAVPGQRSIRAPDEARRTPVPLLLGPTASGKSAAALEVARHLPVEIISVDSAQVYVGMDIGTAKPSPAERAAVPHHLIDIVSPADAYSAARFVADANRLIGDIGARGRLPLLVGGTMLYAHALMRGLHELPTADPAVRAALTDEGRRLGWPAMHARLAAIDPASAARLAPNDAQRIQRAMEIHAQTGRTMTDWLADGDRQRPDGHDFVVVSLEPPDRGLLHRLIAERLDRMLDEGLIDEVAALRARGDLDPGLPSMRCVGYRQTWEYLDGRYDRATLRERAVAATRQLAKRQLTWLRAIPERTVVEALRADSAARVVEALAAAWPDANDGAR